MIKWKRQKISSSLHTLWNDSTDDPFTVFNFSCHTSKQKYNNHVKCCSSKVPPFSLQTLVLRIFITLPSELNYLLPIVIVFCFHFLMLLNNYELDYYSTRCTVRQDFKERRLSVTAGRHVFPDGSREMWPSRGGLHFPTLLTGCRWTQIWEIR